MDTVKKYEYKVEPGDGYAVGLFQNNRLFSTDLAGVTIEQLANGTVYVTFKDSDNVIIRQHRLTPSK